MTRVLLTGAGGFVAHHVLEHLLHETDWHVVATDSFRHKGKTDRIRQVLENGPAGWRHRVDVIMHDLAAPVASQLAGKIGDVDHVLALASLSHVDGSIADPVGFTRNNVDVALSVLEYARKAAPRSLIWVSTDEVYGPLGDREPPHKEWSPILPSNPYAASKAAQEALVVAYWRTYGVPAVIVNAMNLIGERQDPEKFLPKVIRQVSRGETVTVHGRPGHIGTRHYLHARNLADALLFILRNLPPAMFPAHAPRDQVNVTSILDGGYETYVPGGPLGPVADRPDRYNVAGPDRISNLELASMAAQTAGLPLRYELQDFHTTRPGHDPHYGLDPGKLTGLGWKPPVPFAASLAKTVQWTLQHEEWLDG